MELVWKCSLFLMLFTSGLLAQFEDIPGDYCGGPTQRCCDGRIDSCAIPILGTLCYCDQFCNRTDSSDCCPDYWSVCLGIRPPEPLKLQLGCYHEGQRYPYGHTVRINCNKCECLRSLSDSSKTEFLCEADACLVEPEAIQAINGNSAEYGWSAGNHSDFWGRKLEDGLVYRLGTLEPEKFVLNMHPIKQKYDRKALPVSFDGRIEWRDTLQQVRDQGWCGASWAFSTSAVAADRLAIQSRGNEVYPLSMQNLLACNNRGQQGCNGGHLDRAWNYMRRFGVVNEECYPYISGRTGQVEKCKVPRRGNLATMKCRLINAAARSSQDTDKPQRKGLFRTPPAYRIAPFEDDIMNEILQHGPVQATMRVHPDFFLYRTGVYRYSGTNSQQRTGYHSVRIVGWGVDSSKRIPVKYWLVANSWGRQWGENGYFRIVRGENESDIEKFVLAAWADQEDEDK
ncbi:uncharacterized peptidase C1-like protein F26E4.3 [Daphnia carinata]|uniref:uncharacterized peptidase C1-like protein F26E4.3 n=1 Tax=Daphnia carinata TaxID=120202 RepID=UPI00257BBEE6|nr:uncharacterized peptidase C1-like protein F26E4.3 [Daphnia carinata]